MDTNYNSGYNRGNYESHYQRDNELVAYSTSSERAAFYRKTYTHVALAILAFILVETALLHLVPVELIEAMFGGRFIWLLIIGGFWLGSVMATKWSHSLNKNTQYLGLGFYVLLESIIFLPLIYMALAYVGTEVLWQAAIITLSLFAGLTAVVFMTRLDFSFLRSVLIIGGFLSLGLIVAGALFGFELGLWFSIGMVVLAAGGILYETYAIKNEYTTDQYVGAALQLFASVMLLFWYVLRILLSRKN